MGEVWKCEGLDFLEGGRGESGAGSGHEMRALKSFKCLNCKEEGKSEPRSAGRQRYCGKEGCRRASKAASQRRWVSREENAGYFRGKENCERVRRWRAAHPGYWRKKAAAEEERELRRESEAQSAEDKRLDGKSEPAVALQDSWEALQEICSSQPALFVGLISVMTGDALQDDIAASARRLLSRGRDILGMRPGGTRCQSHENKDHHLSRTGEARASPV